MRKSDFLPPVLTSAVRSLRTNASTLTGDYPSWEAAAAVSRPYVSDLEFYGAMARRIAKGEEEPGLTFAMLLAGIGLVGRPAHILDFGGNLAFGYFKTMRVIPGLIASWNVVDLPDVVEYGRANFADGRLRFSTSIDGTPDVLICGSVLNFIPDCYAVLTQLLELKPSIIALDRVPLLRRDRYMIQRVAADLGGGSRAYHALSADRLAACLSGYDKITEIQLRQELGIAEIRYMAMVLAHAAKLAPGKTHVQVSGFPAAGHGAV